MNFSVVIGFSRIPRLLRWHRRLGSLRPVVARLLAQRPSVTTTTQRLS